MRRRKSSKLKDKSVLKKEDKKQDFDAEEDLAANLRFQPRSLVGGVLTDHQVTSLNWMIDLYATQTNGLLADQMGLGKTIQAMAFLAYMKDKLKIRGKFLIVAPLSTVGNWTQELERWLPSLQTVVLYNTQEERDHCLLKSVIPGKFDVLVTSYGGASTCLNYLKKWNFECFILDEAHSIKNANAATCRDLRRIKAVRKLLMTGTPIHNNIYELWTLLNFMMPVLFQNEIIFINFFGKGQGDDE